MERKVTPCWWFGILMAVLTLVLFFGVRWVFAADSCNAPVIINSPYSPNSYLVVWDWLEDGDTSVSCTASTSLYGYILQVQFIPNTTNPPDDSYDVVAEDADGYDWFGGVGADQSSTIDTDANVRTPLTDDSTYYALFGKRLTVTVTNTGSTGTDQGQIQLLIRKF